MEKHHSDNTFLARWISGELSPEEHEAFKKSKDYPVYKKINEASQLLETPSYDKQATYNKLLEQKDNQTKVVKLVPNWAYAAAASVIIAFGLFYALTLEKHYQTSYSEQLALALPDESVINLNANSELDYKSINWKDNRIVKLNGEAFFDIENGASFKVITETGEIEVLGTEFNVVSRENYFEVICFEGKVRVTNNTNQAILTKGKAYRIYKNKAEQWQTTIESPNWLEGESSFRNTPLSQVIISLENQYEINFDKTKLDLDERFTGSFTHSDLNLALKTVFTPMEVSYKSDESNSIILSKTSDKN